MDTAKKDLAERLKSANNILVTVSRNPSVDQLSACLGLALLLNKQGKHTAAVFSGQVPSTIEFLKPEDTLEQNTDSLRDFIIALDKSKADKLRYKVEDNVVRIFITPYKTSISDADLEFSQGDFNVDVVVALGVSRQEDLDEAITAHGRILHDATVASVNTTGDGGLGSINWHDPKASSLSELVTELAQAVGPNMLDGQIATALLTGIVSETDRFSNDKTTSVTMNASAALMAAGANQQLVASKLEEAEQPFAPRQDSIQGGGSSGNNQTPDGMIEIDHTGNDSPSSTVTVSPKIDEAPSFELPSPDTGGLPPLEQSTYQPPAPPAEYTPPVAPLVTPDVDNYASQASFSGSHLSPGPKYMDGPPTLTSTLTANSEVDEEMSPSIDPFNLPNSENPQSLSKTDDVSPAGFTPPPPSWAPPVEPQAQTQSQPSDADLPDVPIVSSLGLPQDQPAVAPPIVTTVNPTPSLAELEAAVKKSEAEAAGGLDTARDEVSRALTSSEATSQATQEPILALGAQPLGSSLHPEQSVGPALASPQGPSLEEQATDIANTQQPQVFDSNSPPPVPPPIPFQFGNPSQQ